MLKSMRYFRNHERRAKRRALIDKSIKYLAKGRLDYKTALHANCPIGTGPTEAAAKTLVNTRMKRAGARFDQHGGQTILTFRAYLLSQRFEAVWKELDASYRGEREAA